ncbi:hypothetical protein ACFL2D_00740 [Patescibacteria group bacterium]
MTRDEYRARELEKEQLTLAATFPVMALITLLFWGAWGVFAPIPVDEFGMTRLWDVAFVPLLALYLLAVTIVLILLAETPPLIQAPTYIFGAFWMIGAIAAVMLAFVFGPCPVLCWHVRLLGLAAAVIYGVPLVAHAVAMGIHRIARALVGAVQFLCRDR